MKTSDSGIKLIKQFEGFMSKPYLDAAGVPTIGYGSTFYANGQPVLMKDEAITEEQASNLMLNVLVKFEDAVNKSVTVPLNQNQFDALVSLTYNIGIAAFKNSTLLERLNAGLYKDAAEQFSRWVYSNKVVLKGLQKRRDQEKTLFLMPPSNVSEFNVKETKMLNGYKTYIGIAISVVSALAAAFGRDWGIDWSGLELAITNAVAALIAVYGYIKKEPK